MLEKAQSLQIIFELFFSKNKSLVGAMDRVVSQSAKYVCLLNSCKRAISFEDFRIVAGGIGELWMNPGFETLVCLQLARLQQKTQN